MYTTNEFIQHWINGTLGRKVKHSTYYLKNFIGNQYLCHLGSGSQQWPHIIGTRIQGPKGPIILTDTRNKDEFLDEVQGWQGYEARFSDLRRAGRDITRIKVVDTKTIGEVTFYLFDIDASYYYTDFKTVNYAGNVEDFLNFRDVEGTKTILKLIPAKGRPSTLKEARASDFPTGVSKDAKVAGRLILLPESLDTTIDYNTLRSGMWKPDPIGFRIPRRYRTHYGLSNELQRFVTGQQVKDFLIEKGESEEIATRLGLFRDEEVENQDAMRAINWHVMDAKDRLDSVGVDTDPDDRWQSGSVQRHVNTVGLYSDPIYVKGKITVRMLDTDTNAYHPRTIDTRIIDLGNQWHRVERRGK